MTRGTDAAVHRVFVDGVQVLELPTNLALEQQADIYWSMGRMVCSRSWRRTATR